MSDAEKFNFKINEKRVMHRLTTKNEIRNVSPDFFSQNQNIIDVKVSQMSHARRFWLAVKFCRLGHSYSGLPVKPKICNIFGIRRSVIVKHLNKFREKLPEDYRYLSPVEDKPQCHCAFFEQYAINYESIKYLFKKK